jgi:hypothetical protein
VRIFFLVESTSNSCIGISKNDSLRNQCSANVPVTLTGALYSLKVK